MRLNDAVIASEKYRGEPTTDEEGRAQWPVCILWDDDLQGFGVRIYPPQRGRPSRKDFIVTWKVGLRTRTMAIGTFGAGCTLRQARKMAREALDLARRGQDPIEARHRALGIGTAEDLASRFLFEHKAAQKKPVPGGDSAAGSGAPAGPAMEPGQSATPGEVGGSAPVEPPPSAPEPVTAAAAGSEIATERDSETPAAPAAQGFALGAPDEPAGLDVLSSAEENDAPPEAPSVFGEDPPVPAETPARSAPAVPAIPTLAAAPATPTVAASPASTAPSPAAPAAPGPAARGPQPPRRPLPPPPARRGPTKVRLLPVPESLYRVIEHGARESSMTIAAYLNALIEIARAAVGEAGDARPGAAGGGPSADEAGPSIRDLFSQVQEAQAVEVGGSDPGDGEPG